MKMRHFLAPLFLLAATALPAVADSTVTLSGVHLCCGSCVKGVTTAVTPVKGATATCDQAKGTVALTAPDNATLQSAVNALTAAGYFGKSSNEAIKVDAASGAPDGKVKTLEVTGVHLCCNSCVTAMKDVVSKVDGIKSDTIKAKGTSFTLTGDFDAKAFMEKLQAAGLTAKVTSK